MGHYRWRRDEIVAGRIINVYWIRMKQVAVRVAVREAMVGYGREFQFGKFVSYLYRRK